MLKSKLARESPATRELRETPELPVYVAPEADEALLAWLMRLATTLNVSIRALCRYGFVYEDCSMRSGWWRRPDPWLLMRISERTGVATDVLQRLTRNGWAPDYRHDEASGRFCGREFDQPYGLPKFIHYAVCTHCLAGDTAPYLRAAWLVGWMAICPVHETRLTLRCATCQTTLKIPSFSSETQFRADVCSRCGAGFVEKMDALVDRPVLELQAALWRAKQSGLAHLDKLGSLNWATVVALLDAILSTFWKGIGLEERDTIYAKYVLNNRQARGEESSPYHARYGALDFISWLITDWPESDGARVGRKLLGRWLSSKQPRVHAQTSRRDAIAAELSQFHSPIRDRLWELFNAGKAIQSRPRMSLHDF